MEEHDLPSEDSSDEDYIPGGVASDVSEEESAGEEGSGGEQIEGEEKVNGKKRGKSGAKKKSRKKMKLKEESNKEEEKDTSEKIEIPEDNKKRSDDLWADFMKDCGPPAKKDNSASKDEVSEVAEEKENDSKVPEQKSAENKVKITEIFEFAGEKVEVEKEVRVSEAKTVVPARGRGGGGGGGLSAVLGQLGRKSKLSTLEKSKLDWEKFKNQEGIAEDITSHNKGRNGYLEKQDFLERADLRQFELEKEMRTTRRSKR